MKIMVVGAKPRSILNFRGELIKGIVANNKYDVYVMASAATTSEFKVIENLGVTYIDYFVSRNGLSAYQDFKTFISLKSTFKKNNPDVILAYTVKPIIWGGIAASFFPDTRFYALVTGLGFAFQKGSWKKNLLVKLVTFLYKVALKRSEKVIFQNPDNQQVFIDLGIVPAYKTCVVNGSGVDVNYFDTKPLPSSPTFLLIARLLGDKGIREYVLAANKVKQKYPNAVFQLLGPEDPSPDGISLEELSKLNNEHSVDYLGATKDVRPYIEGSTIFVLPSYHEGLPRTVLEAMATGRPILTTDVPGCRETVVNNVNGWLVGKANVQELVDRMIWFVENPCEWRRMGDASRTMVEDKFDVHNVNKEIMKIMELNK